MWASIKDFFRRHRRKFIFTGVAIGGAYLLGRYMRWSYREWQHQQELEYIAHARKQHHFESNQKTCTITLFSLLPSVKQTLLEQLNTEAITEQLRQKSENKLQLWEQLKILSFTRTLCSVYSSCLLFVFLRVQLNILGGYMYLDSLLVPEKNDNTLNGTRKMYASGNLQKRYLALVKYMLEDGLLKLIKTVQITVEDILGGISLKEKFNLGQLRELINHVRQGMDYYHLQNSPIKQPSSLSNGNTPVNTTGKLSFVQYMLPTEDEDFLFADSGSESDEGNSKDDMQSLVEETLDILESDDCVKVISTCLDSAFVYVINNIAPFFQPEDYDVSAAESSSSPTLCLPLARIIPIVNGQISSILADTDNRYLQELFTVSCANDFAANIYEAFSHEVD